MDLTPNADRFSGFADLYDAVRPQPPSELGALLWSYAGGRPARLVDLGSGTGLSARWAAGWADEVVGVEPSADMRAIAEAAGGDGVRYVAGWGHTTGLADGCADVVLAVQAMHWMEPTATLAEVARVLRPGGVFATVDCDWPPTVGIAAIERGWVTCRRAIRSREAALVGADPALGSDSGHDPHRDRALAGGVRSWSKEAHLANLEASGRFAWCHELALHRIEDGDADRLVGLLRSQGDYQAMRRAGCDDDELGVSAFARTCRDALGSASRALLFTYRVRLGVTPAGL